MAVCILDRVSQSSAMTCSHSIGKPLSDPTGYSSHGDFLNGWDVTALQNAIDHCNNPNDATGSGDTEACSYLTVQSSSAANNCKISPSVSETTTGVLYALPG